VALAATVISGSGRVRSVMWQVGAGYGRLDPVVGHLKHQQAIGVENTVRGPLSVHRSHRRHSVAGQQAADCLGQGAGHGLGPRAALQLGP
jgi:hypothetical protein